MSLETEKAFWEFVARERAKVREVGQEQKDLDWVFRWLEKELRIAEQSKRRFFGSEDGYYWEGYFDALLDVKRILREWRADDGQD
jgi:hypothetical protein